MTMRDQEIAEREERKAAHREWLENPHTEEMLALLRRIQSGKIMNLAQIAADAKDADRMISLGGRVAGIGDAIKALQVGGAE